MQIEMVSGAELREGDKILYTPMGGGVVQVGEIKIISRFKDSLESNCAELIINRIHHYIHDAAQVAVVERAKS